MTLNKRIESARERKGWSMAKLGREVGVTRTTVHQWETGQTKGLKPENLYAVSKALGVSMEWLITGRHDDTVRESQNIYGDVSQNPTTAALIDAILESDRRGTLSPEVADGLRRTITALKPAPADHRPGKKTARD